MAIRQRRRGAAITAVTCGEALLCLHRERLALWGGTVFSPDSVGALVAVAVALRLS